MPTKKYRAESDYLASNDNRQRWKPWVQDILAILAIFLLAEAVLILGAAFGYNATERHTTIQEDHD